MNQESLPAERWTGTAPPDEPALEMTAMRIHRFGEPPRPDRLPVPHVGEDEVLVKMAATVVSHHDLTVAGGEFAVRPTLPYTPGLEGAGRVVLVGGRHGRSNPVWWASSQRASFRWRPTSSEHETSMPQSRGCGAANRRDEWWSSGDVRSSAVDPGPGRGRLPSHLLYVKKGLRDWIL